MQELSERVVRDEPGIDPEHYLRERYIDNDPQPLLGPYYALKPLMPRRLQLALRRQHAKRRARTEFPRWPVEDVLVRHQADAFARRIEENGGDPVPFVNFWPS